MRSCSPLYYEIHLFLHLLSLLSISNHLRPDSKLSINLFIYEFDPNNEKIENVLSMQIRILNLLSGKVWPMLLSSFVSFSCPLCLSHSIFFDAIFKKIPPRTGTKSNQMCSSSRCSLLTMGSGIGTRTIVPTRIAFFQMEFLIFILEEEALFMSYFISPCCWMFGHCSLN